MNVQQAAARESWGCRVMCASDHEHDGACYRHHGCRCGSCRTAMRDYMRERRGSGPRGWVGAEYLRMAGLGLTVEEIAAQRAVQAPSVERTLRRATKTRAVSS